MSQVDQWPPHSCVRLSEAVGAHTVPAINLWNFVNESMNCCLVPMKGRVFPEGGGKSMVTFLYVSGKGPIMLLQKMRIIRDYAAFCDKPLDSRARLCFSRGPCTLSGI